MQMSKQCKQHHASPALLREKYCALLPDSSSLSLSELSVSLSLRSLSFSLLSLTMPLVAVGLDGKEPEQKLEQKTWAKGWTWSFIIHNAWLFYCCSSAACDLETRESGALEKSCLPSICICNHKISVVIYCIHRSYFIGQHECQIPWDVPTLVTGWCWLV